MGKGKEVFSTFMSDKERGRVWWGSLGVSLLAAVVVYVSSFLVLLLPFQVYADKFSYSTFTGLFFMALIVFVVSVVFNVFVVRVVAAQVNRSADLLYGPVKGFVFKRVLLFHAVLWCVVFFWFAGFSFSSVVFAVILCVVHAWLLPVLFLRARNVFRPHLVRPKFE